MKNILNVTKSSIILNAFVSLFFVLFFIFLPGSGFRDMFSKFSLIHKISSFILSWIISFIIYYPFVTSVAYITKSIKISSYKVQEIILAIILILIFNPFSISMLVSKFGYQIPSNSSEQILQENVNNNVAIETSVCGLKISEILENSNVRESGINIGDVILKINDVEIRSVQNIFEQLNSKRPGDSIYINTNNGAKIVKLAMDSNDIHHAVLGVKLVPYICDK